MKSPYKKIIEDILKWKWQGNKFCLMIENWKSFVDEIIFLPYIDF